MRRVGPLLVVLCLAGCGGSSGHASPTPTATPKPQLPGGGRVIFHGPKRRIVAFYGNPQDEELGVLGIGSPKHAAHKLKRYAARYRTRRRPVLPAMELLADVATYAPGDDGKYRTITPDRVIRRYLRAARSVGAELILDIQPGYADFLTESKRLTRWLRKPDVSLALDPEWHVPIGQVPGKVIGSVDASEVVSVERWLDALTARLDLPQKVLIVHQFTEGMVRDKALLRPFAHVALVLNIDGFGTQAVKTEKYRAFAKDVPFAFNGFKLFFKEDSGLMRPRQVLRLHPSPDVIVYE